MTASIASNEGPRGLMRCVLVVAALLPAHAGCKKDGVECTPPPTNLTCADAAPSFAADVYPNVFAPACVSCHSPTGVEPSSPLTTYQQIYGSNGSEAREIFNQVFESCLMPPAGAAVPLTAPERQTLLDWFACGAQDSAPADSGVND